MLRTSLLLTPIVMLTLINGLNAQPFIFSEPENVLSISSNRWDNMPHLSRDGLRMYYSFEPPIGLPGEIYMASRESVDGPFGTPQPLGGSPGKINFLGGLTDDELAIYYSSFAPPGGGRTVVQVARRTRVEDPFDFRKAETLNLLGSSQQMGHISGDGSTIYFNVEIGDPNNGGRVDAYVSSDPEFAEATQIDTEGRSLSVEYVTTDELMMFSWNSGDSDLHMSWRSSVEEDFGPWTNLGPVINSTGYDETFPFFHESTSTLYFSSDRQPGTIVPQEGRSPAVRDIWQSKVSFPGDFDFDHAFTAADVDALSDAIRDGQYHYNLDTNHDGHVDLNDHHRWIHDVNFANTYYGDANLDGEFNSNDIVEVFQAGKYENDVDAGWAQGDWTGDGRFDSGDLVAAFQDGGYQLGARGAVSAVPEPASVTLLLIGMTIMSLLCPKSVTTRPPLPNVASSVPSGLYRASAKSPPVPALKVLPATTILPSA